MPPPPPPAQVLKWRCTAFARPHRYLHTKRMSMPPTPVPPTAGLASYSVCTNSVGPSSVSGMGDAAATVAPASESDQQVALLADAPPSSASEHCWKSKLAKPCAQEHQELAP